MDEGLLFLVQQTNQLSLGADEAVDIPIFMIQKPHDGGLFAKRGQEDRQSLDLSVIEILPARMKPGRGHAAYP